MLRNSKRSVAAASSLWLLCVLLAGCAVNPVTGEREIRLLSESQEIALGEQNYLPMRQSQGGDYVLDPALGEYVRQVGQRVAAVSDRPLPYEFEVLNNSVPNAWALPGGKIAINRGLLTELDSEAELAAVLGHEIVHAAAGHSANAMERAMLLQTGVLIAAVAGSESRYGQFATLGASVAAQLINQRFSRSAELESDRYGMEYMSRAGYDPQGAVDLQETFVRLNADRASGWLEGLFASHPPSAARVEANRATAASLAPGGESGTERYRQMLAKTRAAEPAYEAYAEGRKALAEGRTDVAMQRAAEAISLAPGEGHFYALRGDAHMRDGEYEAARREFTAALERNDEFFYYYLQRGLGSEKMGNDAEARQDLEASVELLPSGPAYLALGNIEKRAGNIERAKAYYRSAAQAQGEVGREAQTALMRMDLTANPETYLGLRSGLDERGRLLVQLANPTAVAVHGVRLSIRYLTSEGKVAQVDRRVRGILEAGQSVRLDTGLGPFTATSQYEVRIIGASVAD